MSAASRCRSTEKDGTISRTARASARRPRAPTSLALVSRSPRQTHKLGERLGAAAQAGDVYLLVGDLGAGKTTLAQGIARGLGVNEYTSSPSFVLMKEYRGRLTMYHMDLYRLDREEEMLDLGLESYFSGQGVCVVEWAEKLGRLKPKEHLLIAISHRGEKERLLELKARGERYRKRLAQRMALFGTQNSLLRGAT